MKTCTINCDKIKTICVFYSSIRELEYMIWFYENFTKHKKLNKSIKFN